MLFYHEQVQFGAVVVVVGSFRVAPRGPISSGTIVKRAPAVILVTPLLTLRILDDDLTAARRAVIGIPVLAFAVTGAGMIRGDVTGDFVCAELTERQFRRFLWELHRQQRRHEKHREDSHHARSRRVRRIAGLTAVIGAGG